MFMKIHKRMKSQKGFTLIELLVVIIIIAILAAIAIPTFLGQRQKAYDAAAKSLVRNAMTSMESYYVDTRTFASATGPLLAAIEPSIAWHAVDANMVTASGTLAITSASSTANNSVDYWGGAAVPTGAAATTSVFSISTASASGNIFGMYTDKASAAPTGGTTFVKKIGTDITTGW